VELLMKLHLRTAGCHIYIDIANNIGPLLC